MLNSSTLRRTILVVSGILVIAWSASAAQKQAAKKPTDKPSVAAQKPAADARMKRRWLFVTRDMLNPKEVDRTIALLPGAHEAGYNELVCSGNVAAEKAADLREAAKKNGLEIIATVMGGAKNRNYVEGVPVKDALFVVSGGRATHKPDNPTKVLGGDFEGEVNNRFTGWSWQDDIGVTTFADHEIAHSGNCSLRMENIGKNEHQLCRLSQAIKLQPHRQYHVSFWLRTENLKPAVPEFKVLTDTPQGCVSWQTFHVEPTQGWKQVDLVFNSFDETAGRIYIGFWSGKDGKIWWDDLKVEEVGLVNVLRRLGCPVTVRGETNGTVYEEGKDYEKIADPEFHPWIAYRGSNPSIKLTADSRIKDGERLRVSYYHPIIIYDDRVNFCLSEPKVFEDWKMEILKADELLHPAGFFMSHDEIRCMNQCASCRAKNMTAGELLAWNIKKAAAIIRDIRPDASIWVWNDMFDPMHNAQEHFYAVNGTLAGSWKGLDKDVGIVNWHGGLQGKNCKFFADLGLKQILSGYYDGDEDGSAIVKWEENTKDVPGVVGAMYTTWEDKYGAMGVWGEKAWGARK